MDNSLGRNFITLGIFLAGFPLAGATADIALTAV